MADATLTSARHTSPNAVHHRFFRLVLAGQIVVFALMVLGTLLASNPASAQNVLKDFLNENQIQIDPNQGQIKIVPNNNLCLHPFIKVNGQCVCPVGQKKVGNTCKPIVIQILCQAPFVPNANGNKCVCPIGQKKVGNTCKPIIIQILCKAPFVLNANGNKCVCPFGAKKVGNTCQQIQIQILCKAPFVPNFNGNKCVCPAGLDKVGNKCLPQVYNPQCDWPFVYKSSSNTCVCARGYRLNNSGNRCIKKKPAPTVAKAVVTEIQYCLGKLGYDAGPADGAPGRRTRNAWSNFRRDEGLQGRPNTLADDVTQDRLFQACARVEEAPESEEESDTPATDGTNSGTNFDPETGYPQIQCASKAVAILLQGLVGQDEEIGICGEVCVPIPDGMTPEQVEGTSASVNWCRNCTKVGEDGLLCSAAPEEDAAN